MFAYSLITRRGQIRMCGIRKGAFLICDCAQAAVQHQMKLIGGEGAEGAGKECSPRVGRFENSTGSSLNGWIMVSQ
jgi:hypothetical protein